MQTLIGCWTCRRELRHVKCDCAVPACLQCTSRHIRCHGYGAKPGWMDGGTREREEKSRVKAAVKKNFRRQRVKRSRAQREREAGHATRSSSPEEATFVDSVETQPANPGTHLPMTSLFARPFPYEESTLLMHYLDHVFPLQYFYYSDKTWARGWLLWLLSKNGPLYRASLSLAALHLRSLHKGETPNVDIEYHTGALRELQEFIARFEAGESQGDDELLAEVLACGAALVSFEVLNGSTNNWQPHLYGSTSIVKSMDHEALLARPLENMANIHLRLRPYTGAEAALAFHLPVMLWMDLCACVSTRQRPKLPYKTWLGRDSSINLENMMGCRNGVMECIGDLGALEEWKVDGIEAGTFDVDEFDARCGQIDDELENELEALHMRGPKETNDSLVTRIFATAALVQLHIISANVSPRWSAKLLHRAVTRVVREIQSCTETPSARRIIWPICVVGSVAGADQRGFFERLLKEVLDEAGGMVGNCHTVLEIMERCKEFQAEEEDVLWDCSGSMMRMGIRALLI